jgi:hypothetical protein
MSRNYRDLPGQSAKRSFGFSRFTTLGRTAGKVGLQALISLECEIEGCLRGNFEAEAIEGAVAVMRERASEMTRGIEPRISALAGTFLVCAVVLLPCQELSAAGELAATRRG